MCACVRVCVCTCVCTGPGHPPLETACFLFCPSPWVKMSGLCETPGGLGTATLIMGGDGGSATPVGEDAGAWVPHH